MSMHENTLKIEDCLNRAQAIAHLLSDKAGDLNCAESIRRSGSMIEDEMRQAQAALDDVMDARRAEKGGNHE